MPKIEFTLKEFREDYDWGQIFADPGENCTAYVIPDTREAAPGSNVDLTLPTRKDVVKILALVNGEGDGSSWYGLFKLRDGRYVYADASCCYTGWDCQGGSLLVFASNLREMKKFGMSDLERERLELV